MTQRRQTKRNKFPDPNSELRSERWAVKIDNKYNKACREGRGIKRLLVAFGGIIPYMMLTIILGIIMFTVYFIYWLILPKEEYRRRFK